MLLRVNHEDVLALAIFGGPNSVDVGRAGRSVRAHSAYLMQEADRQTDFGEATR